jgi:hypothetical protein
MRRPQRKTRISEAKGYVCYFTAPKFGEDAAVTGAQKAENTAGQLKTLLTNGYPTSGDGAARNVMAKESSNFIVRGTFTAPRK